MSSIKSVLRDKRLKITPQREEILKFLDNKTHPSIDEIYENVKIKFPSISLATVYKNLNMLREQNIVLEINSNKVKYDLNIEPHLHIVCKNCGSIQDIFDNQKYIAIINELKPLTTKAISSLEIVLNIEKCEKCC